MSWWVGPWDAAACSGRPVANGGGSVERLEKQNLFSAGVRLSLTNAAFCQAAISAATPDFIEPPRVPTVRAGGPVTQTGLPGFAFFVFS